MRANREPVSKPDAEDSAQLQALRGDEGAPVLLEEHAGLVKPIKIDDPGVCRDIDTPDDLR